MRRNPFPILFCPERRRTGQCALPQHIGHRRHQVEHRDRHAGKRTVDKRRKIRCRCSCPEPPEQFPAVQHLRPAQTAHHGHQIQQRGEIRHQRPQRHRNHHIEQPPEDLPHGCSRCIAPWQAVPGAQSTQQKVQPAHGGGQRHTQHCPGSRQRRKRHVRRHTAADDFRMRQHPLAQRQSQPQLCHSLQRLGDRRRRHVLQSLPVATFHCRQTAEQRCRRNGEQRKQGIGLRRNQGGERLCQQEHTQAEEQPQDAAGKACRIPDTPHLCPVFQRRRTGDRLRHRRRQPGDRQGIHRQQQPVGSAEISHSRTAQHIGQRYFETRSQQLGNHGRCQQQRRAFPERLLSKHSFSPVRIIFCTG